MKEVLVRDLRVGDIYYYNSRYEVVLDITSWSVYVKCIMAPATQAGIPIGSKYHIVYHSKVKLLCRDGKVV